MVYTYDMLIGLIIGLVIGCMLMYVYMMPDDEEIRRTERYRQRAKNSRYFKDWSLKDEEDH